MPYTHIDARQSAARLTDEKMTTRGRHAVMMALMTASLLASAATVRGAEQTPAEKTPAPPARTWAVSLRLENDTFADSDHFYTNGLGVALSHTGPSWADPLFNLLPWRSGRRTVSYTVNQAMFTPDDTDRAIPAPTDRPYAGMLTFALGLDADQPNRYDGLRLVLGVVGPLSGAEDVQRWWHHVIGDKVPQGWAAQLDNEPVFNLFYEHRRRFRLVGSAEGWGAEVIPVGSVALGNLLVQGHLAGIVRLGYRMPQDFGPTLLRGMNQLPPRRPTSGGETGLKSLGVALLGGIGVNLVLRDLTLDGNTFKDSPSVDKRWYVPGAMVGVEIGNRDFLATFQYVFLGKEFEGQRNASEFGALTVSFFF
jgi:hypothetical protein